MTFTYPDGETKLAKMHSGPCPTRKTRVSRNYWCHKAKLLMNKVSQLSHAPAMLSPYSYCQNDIHHEAMKPGAPTSFVLKYRLEIQAMFIITF